jgi:flavin-binding protein dodecin
MSHHVYKCIERISGEHNISWSAVHCSAGKIVDRKVTDRTILK